MATAPLQFSLLLVAVAVSAASSSALRPSDSHDFYQSFSPQQISGILSTLGFQQLSAVAAAFSLFNATAVTPTTVFAATDYSLLGSPSCSFPLLLLEHSVAGLYPYSALRKLAFGTKIHTLAPNRCLTITFSGDDNSTAESKIFVGGVEIAQPELYNDGHIIVHGIEGFLSHLSPLSCHVERMTSLSLPPTMTTSPLFVMRRSLKDALAKLRTSGYSVVSLALRENYINFLDLKAMTVFAVDDASIFSCGHVYVSDLRFHVVPNRLLTAADLMHLPVETALPTMEWGQKLVMTVAGGGGLLTPMRINHVKVTRPDLVYNSRIVVHGVAAPFPRVHHTVSGFWPDQTDEMESCGPSAAADLGDRHVLGSWI